MKISDGVYLVTGATNGIGKSICDVLDKKNMRYIAIGRNKEKLENMFQENYFVCDFISFENCEKLFDYCERKNILINGLIHSAGICYKQNVSDIEKEDMLKLYNVNTFAYLELFKCLNDYKYLSDDVRALAISSITANRPYKNQILYSSSKAALNSIALSAAQLGLERNIKSNVIELGAVNTDMFKALKPNLENINRHYPLGILEKEEVAEIICSFLSPIYKKMTGSVIKIDSGFSMVH